MRVIGVDCSTTECGWAIVDYERGTKNRTLVDYGHHTFTKFEDLSDRLFEFASHVIDKLWEAKPDKVVLEDFLKAFNGGTTSASAMMGLAHMNGGIDYILRDRFGRDVVEKVHPSTARKNAIGTGVLTKKTAQLLGYLDPRGSILTKQWILDEVTKLYPNFQIKELTPRSKKPMPYYFDIADAVILASSLV